MRIGAVSLILCLLAAACAGSSNTASEVESPSTEVSPSTSVVGPAPATSESPPTSVAPSTTIPPAIQLIEEVTGDGITFLVPIAAERYGTELLPIEFKIDLPEPAVRVYAEPGYMYLGTTKHSGEANEGVAIVSPARLAHPDSIPAFSSSPDEWVDVPDDLGSWLSQIEQLTITDSGSGEIGGLSGNWWDVHLNDDPALGAQCGDQNCTFLFPSSSGGEWWIRSDNPNRIWQMDVGATQLFVIVEAEETIFESWIARSQIWLDGIEFGALVDREAVDSPAAGEFDLGRTEVTFVDSTRRTDELTRDGAVVVEAADHRSLTVTLAYPARVRGRDSEPADGQFPLVVQAHALGGTNRITATAEALVSNGFVVAAIRFPESSSPGGSFRYFAEQPADISFVLDQLLSDGLPAVLEGIIDGEKIGIIGRSLGGSTVYGLVGADCCRDERIDAAVSQAGIVLSFGDEDWQNPPTLIVGSQADENTRIETLREIAAKMQAPVSLLELTDEGHLDWTVPTSPNFIGVINLVVAFFDQHLRDGDPARVEEIAEEINGVWQSR